MLHLERDQAWVSTISSKLYNLKLAISLYNITSAFLELSFLSTMNNQDNLITFVSNLKQTTEKISIFKYFSILTFLCNKRLDDLFSHSLLSIITNWSTSHELSMQKLFVFFLSNLIINALRLKFTSVKIYCFTDFLHTLSKANRVNHVFDGACRFKT